MSNQVQRRIVARSTRPPTAVSRRLRRAARTTGSIGGVLITATFATLATAPLAHGDPAYNTRTEQVVDSLNPDPAVEISWVSLYSPLTTGFDAHPPECDWIHYMRYRDKNGPRDSADADAVVSAQAGFQGGASTYDIKARQVVKKAAAQGKHVEFWAVERRPTCLVDRTGIDAATAAHDYHVAVDYYFHGATVDGRRYGGTLDWWNVPGSPHGSASWLRDMRQEQDNRDWHQIMAEAIPDAAARGRKVFCGGHSYGGLIAGLYSAWDFDLDRASVPHDGPGYAQCAGFFADDSLVTPDPAGAGNMPVLGSLVDMVAGLAYTYNRGIPGVVGGLSSLYPYLDSSVVLTPETYYLIEIIAMAAYFEPDQETDLLRILPHTLNTEATLRLFLSRTYQQAITNTPDVWSFRYTNAALFGAVLGSQGSPVSILSNSMGSYGDCPVADKDFPVPNQLADLHLPFLDELRKIPLFAQFPDIGDLISHEIAPGARRVAPVDPNILCTWRSYDEDPAPVADGAPYAAKSAQVVDLHDFARTWFEGPSNYIEIYLPYVDGPGNLFMANMKWWEYAAAPHREDVYHRPMLTTLGSIGEINDGIHALNPLTALFPVPGPLVPENTVYAPGRHHFDVVAAAEKQNDGKPEIGSQAMVDWIVQNTGR
ncbi:hypothetical protein [Nocardia arthritidis]|uniref:Alpha/beta hydrolase n=1 Tax=Nocardia arthritidis TaxID=228602 RepID=A0A6G9YKW2_9NOCA|nr:hypothetical protein [Nocardia arthritidis]QIS13844.1 hypothetical protein F5544_29995 [Nocardia arthritidis]